MTDLNVIAARALGYALAGVELEILADRLDTAASSLPIPSNTWLARDLHELASLIRAEA
jgi:hypothetical protein